MGAGQCLIFAAVWLCYAAFTAWVDGMGLWFGVATICITICTVGASILMAIERVERAAISNRRA